MTLSEATAEITARLGIEAKVLPATDDRVETLVQTPAGKLSFQEYFVKRHYQDSVSSVHFHGAGSAQPAPGVAEAILSAEAVLLAPSNPVTSIGPMLAVPGIRKALHETPASVTAISPIVGGAAVSGPAGALMAACGLPISPAGVAQAYQDFMDVLIADTRDQEAVAKLDRSGLRVHCTNTMMKAPTDRIELARAALSAVSRCKTRP